MALRDSIGSSVDVGPLSLTTAITTAAGTMHIPVPR